MENGDRSQGYQKGNSTYVPSASGIPLPSLLPKGWPLIVIDLKDCFFTIPLQEKDREKFAFAVPTYKNSQPMRRYQWTLLPRNVEQYHLVRIF